MFSLQCPRKLHFLNLILVGEPRQGFAEAFAGLAFPGRVQQLEDWPSQHVNPQTRDNRKRAFAEDDEGTYSQSATMSPRMG